MKELRIFFPFIVILGLFLFVLGIVLIFRATKEEGKLKTFLLITGISAVSPFIFTLLHNLFYGLAITFTDFGYIFILLHVISFIISLVLAPILFIIGGVSTLFYLKHKEK